MLRNDEYDIDVFNVFGKGFRMSSMLSGLISYLKANVIWKSIMISRFPKKRQSKDF